MIIYNVTVKVDNKIADEWLTWLQEEHIPGIMQTDCFTDFRVVRLLEVDDSEGPTYAIQYHAASLDEYDIYIKKFASENRKRSHDKWGNKIISFHSLMEVVK